MTYAQFSGVLAFVAAGGVATLLTQNLPNDLVFDDVLPITFVISSASVKNVATDGTYLTAFKASGTGNIGATQIPEPGSVMLLVAGCFSLLALGRRRRGR